MMKLAKKPGKINRKLTLVMALISGLIFTLDLVTPLGIATGVSYIFVIMLGYFSNSNKKIIAFSVLCIGLVMIGYFYSPGRINSQQAIFSNRLISVSCIFITAFFTTTLKNLSLKNKKNESLLKSILSSSNESVLVINEEGKIVYNNDSANQMFGFSEDELHGLDIDRIFPPDVNIKQDTASNGADQFENQTNKSQGSNITAKRKLGTELPTDVTLGHFKTSDGLFLTCFIIDITRRKKMEAELKTKNDLLKKSENFLQSIIRNLPLHISVTEVDSGKKVLENNPSVNLLEFSEAKNSKQITSTGIIDINFEQIKLVQAADAELILTGKTITIPELSVNIIDEEDKIIRLIKAPVLNGEGKAMYIINICEDISNMVSIRQDLKSKNQLILETQEIGNVGSFERDFHTSVLTVTKELNSILGLDPHQLKYPFDRLMKLIHPDDHAGIKAAIKDAILDHEIIDKEFRIIRPDKAERHVWIKAKVVYDSQASPLFLRGLILDITDRKKADRDRETYIDDLKKMLFMTSHKVRVPVANILGISNLMENSLNSPDLLTKLVGHNRSSALLLDEFTKELTVFMEGSKHMKE